MEGLQVAGIVAFIYGVLWASSLLRDAKRDLDAEHLRNLHGIERMTLANGAGPLLPLVAGLGVVGIWERQALAIAVTATVIAVMLLFARGMVHARRMGSVGVPAGYRHSYRKAHAIRAVALGICASTLLYPLVRQSLG